MESKSALEKTIKVILWASLSLVIAMSVLLSVMVWVMTPSRLTPIARQYANEYLVNSKCHIGKVDLSVWRTFPYVTIEVDTIEIVSSAFKALPAEERAKLPADADTLLSLAKFKGGVNLFNIAVGKFTLNDIMLESLKANAVAYSDSLTNWDIVPKSVEQKQDEESSMPDILINSVELNHCRGVRFFALSDSIDAAIQIHAAQIRISNDDLMQFLFDSQTSLTIAGEQMLRDLPINVNGMIDWQSSDPQHVGLKDWKIAVAESPIRLSLDGKFGQETVISKCDITIGEVKIMSMRNYLSPKYERFFDLFDTDLRATLQASLTKPYKPDGIVPSAHVSLDVPKSYIKEDNGRQIDDVRLSVEAEIDGDNPDASTVTLNNLSASGSSISLRASGKAERLVSNPRIVGELACNANILDAVNFLHLPLDFYVNGNVEADTKLDFTLADITNQKYKNIGVHGNINLTQFKYQSVADTVDMYAHKAHFNMGSKEKYRDIDNREHHNLLKAHFTIDSLVMNLYGSEIKVIKGEANAGIVGDTPKKGKVIPMGGVIKAERLSYVDVDSSRYGLQNVEGRAISRAYQGSDRPAFDFNLKALQGGGINNLMRGGVYDTEIALSIMPRERNKRNKSRLQMRYDSLAMLHPTLSRDSLMILAGFGRRQETKSDKEETLDLSVDTLTQGLLRRWAMIGSLVAKRAIISTPYFPLTNHIDNLDLGFSADSLIVNSGRYQAGRSSFDIQGGIRNMRSAMLGYNRRPLLVNFKIDSDTLDFNELINAAYAGMNFSNSNASKDVVLSDSAQIDNMIEEADTSRVMFMVPRNLDVDIDMDARHGYYADMKLSDFGGCLQIHDGALQLNDIHTNSDAGKISLDALYATANKDKSHFAINLGMDNVDLARFIKMVPAVDSLMPLLNSMSGIIKAEIAAATDVDSTMNIIMPTLNAAVKLRGDSLVLFDSETFAKVSKMMLFKNKKRNMIDNMEVQIVVKDNVMQLYPFVFNMDRYKLGVMGSNDFALNLNYHISVLKSPIPFRFGINIKGNADNMKFRLGRAKFKEGQIGESVAIVDAQRINLRREIENAFRRGAAAALNSNLKLASSTRDSDSETLSHSDSLQMIEQGLIEDKSKPLSKEQVKAQKKEKKLASKKAEKRRKREEQAAIRRAKEAIKKD